VVSAEWPSTKYPCWIITSRNYVHVGSATASLAKEGLLFNFKPYTYQHLLITLNKNSFCKKAPMLLTVCCELTNPAFCLLQLHILKNEKKVTEKL
jgi:hypothetical protein